MQRKKENIKQLKEDKEQQQEKVMKTFLPAIYKTIKSPHFKIIVDNEAYCMVTLNDKQLYPNLISELHEEVEKLVSKATPGNRTIMSKLEFIKPFLFNHRRNTIYRESHIPAQITLFDINNNEVKLEEQGELIKQKIEGFYKCFYSLIEIMLTNIDTNYKWRNKARTTSKFKAGKCDRNIIAYSLGVFHTNSIILADENNKKVTNGTTFTNELVAQLGLEPIKNVSAVSGQITKRQIDEYALLYGEFYVLFHGHFPKGTHFDSREKAKDALLAEKELLPISLFVYDVITDYVKIVHSYKGVYPETIFPWLDDKSKFDEFLAKRSSSSIINNVMRNKVMKNVYFLSNLCYS